MINFELVPNISNNTKIMYTTKLNRLLSICQSISTNTNTLLYVLNHPNKTYWLIRDTFSNWNTINSYIVPIITILKWYPDLINLTNVNSIERWNYLSKHSKEKCTLLKLDNANQKNIKTTYNDLINKLENITGTDQLLLSMYTLIPPVRCDYHKLKIDYEHKYYEYKPNENTIFIYENDAYICLIDYKTKNAYGNHIIKVPSSLFDIIKNNITNSQHYLFENTNKKPYTRSAFSDYVRHVMFKLFNENITINTLRHLYITHHIKLDTNPADKLNISKKMLHSTDTQIKYIWAK